MPIDGTLGGYEWRIYFLSNTGTYNGLSFPPGSGNIDPLTVTYVQGTQALGTAVRVQGLTYQDGSTPIDGAFVLQMGSNSNSSTSMTTMTTDLVQYDQSPLELKYMLESAGVVGQASVSSSLRTMQPLPGVYASVDKDSGVVTIQYDKPQTKSAAGFLEPGADIRQVN